MNSDLCECTTGTHHTAVSTITTTTMNLHPQQSPNILSLTLPSVAEEEGPVALFAAGAADFLASMGSALI